MIFDAHLLDPQSSYLRDISGSTGLIEASVDLAFLVYNLPVRLLEHGHMKNYIGLFDVHIVSNINT